MSVLDRTFELNSPAVISDEVGGEVLAIHLDTGTYFVFPQETLTVWSALSEGVAPRLLLSGSYDPRTDALVEYVERLLALQLLRPSDTLRLLDEPPEWQAQQLTVQAYTDLADLLGPDPIHDADEELGWPAIRDGR